MKFKYTIEERIIIADGYIWPDETIEVKPMTNFGSYDYTDLSGLVAPYKLSEPKPQVATGNGVRYTGEYYLLMGLAGQANDIIKAKYRAIMASCTVTPGVIKRSPLPSNDLEQQDDHLGYLAACRVLGLYSDAEQVLNYGFKHLGFFNTDNPGSYTSNGTIFWKAFLWRMPQLFFVTLCAADKYRFWKFWYWPAMLITAFVIAVSAYNKPTSDIDSRGLTFLMVMATSSSSLTCRLASKLFYKFVKQVYPAGMVGAYTQAYGADHPLTKLMAIAKL